MVEEIGRARAANGGRGMVVENSPVDSSASNGYTERAIQGVQGMVRTWRKRLTGEVIVGSNTGVSRTRTVRRKTEEERWAAGNLELVGGLPWRPENVEGEDLKTEVTIMDKEYRESLRGKIREEPPPRRLYIRKQDVERHGYTARCPG